jgi:hypothetical protein
MQKKMRKLTLSRETLRHLAGREWRAVGAAKTFRNCNTDEDACPISAQPLCSEAPTGCVLTGCTCP